jgi:hypothetical protein
MDEIKYVRWKKPTDLRSKFTKGKKYRVEIRSANRINIYDDVGNSRHCNFDVIEQYFDLFDYLPNTKLFRELHPNASVEGNKLKVLIK